MAAILLTADRSLMNRFHALGDVAIPSYGACNSLPPIPFRLFARPPLHDGGLARFAPYPLRKVESCLLDAGLDVATVVPEGLPRHLAGARVLGVHSVDPLGLATAPATGLRLGAWRHSVSRLRRLLAGPEVVGGLLSVVFRVAGLLGRPSGAGAGPPAPHPYANIRPTAGLRSPASSMRR